MIVETKVPAEVKEMAKEINQGIVEDLVTKIKYHATVLGTAPTVKGLDSRTNEVTVVALNHYVSNIDAYNILPEQIDALRISEKHFLNLIVDQKIGYKETYEQYIERAKNRRIHLNEKQSTGRACL